MTHPSYCRLDRNGAKVWVVGKEEIRPGIYIGIVDGETDDKKFRDGDIIAFVAAEVDMVTTDREWALQRAAENKAKFGF